MPSQKRTLLETLDKKTLIELSKSAGLTGMQALNKAEIIANLTRKRSIGLEDLLDQFGMGTLKHICAKLGLNLGGVSKQDQIDKILGREGLFSKPRKKKKPKPEPISNQPEPETCKPKWKPPMPDTKGKTIPKLALARLERKLFEACDILRGNMDASEYKEYIFGMLFLKRMSDQFDLDQERLRRGYENKGLKPDLTEKQLANPDKYDFFIPEHAHWSKLKHLKSSVGSGLNKALAAIEDANPNTLQDVLKGINFNRKIGQRTMEDSTLVEFIQHFDKIPLSNDDFEFPDLLGAAYEYLIKYFADSAGKKGGEFYTPAGVVRTMVQLIEPHEGMSVYDPCAGSGGMLIQSTNFVQETGGDSRNMFLAGQELNGGTWSICKMNMILHGVRSADIRQGDTIKDPQHIDKNAEIKRFDRVIANPPFSQNYSKKDMKFAERFHTFMPESGKKADLMFVQHMVSSIKSDGKMAVVMPHGVLFRGGEERECRKRFIKDGVLEAVIGLPPALFYGTGIPACILVMNKKGAGDRDSVLFINADREYKEGKNQNSLRAEDIEKISHVYLNHLEVPKYSRKVPVSELEQEDFNLNIRRYVENSPPPEPHDVRAHLNGGVPLKEIEALQGFYNNYLGLRELLFEPRVDGYSDFALAVQSKETIKTLVESAQGVSDKHTSFDKALSKWWDKNVSIIEALPGSNNGYELRRQFMATIAEALVPQGILDLHQVRGAFAAYMNSLEADFKSVAASGWGPELIPEDDIIKSQFPEVLNQIESDKARIAELEALFAAADEEDAEPDEETGVLPSGQVKALKDEKKESDAKWKAQLKMLKNLIGDLYTLLKKDDLIAKGQKKGEFNEGLTVKVANFDVAERILDLAKPMMEHKTIVEQIISSQTQGKLAKDRSDKIDEQLKTHTDLEKELKDLKTNIKQVEKKKEALVDAARSKISESEAKELILGRFKQLLTEKYDGYLRQYQRSFISAVENLWDKYSVTMKQIFAKRDREAEQLNQFLMELGYEQNYKNEI